MKACATQQLMLKTYQLEKYTLFLVKPVFAKCSWACFVRNILYVFSVLTEGRGPEKSVGEELMHAKAKTEKKWAENEKRTKREKQMNR